MGTYGYKDGNGEDKYDNTVVNEFWDDFKSMETFYRKPGPAAKLAETAAKIGGPNVACKSNFNKTRAAGEMHQHTWALAMMRAILSLEETHPGNTPPHPPFLALPSTLHCLFLTPDFPPR